MEEFRSVADRRERQLGTLGNIQKRVLAVGKIQDPKTRVNFLTNCFASAGPIEISLAQLRFAKRIQVPVAAIAFQHVKKRSTQSK
jgi:hypothetical protein